MRHVRSSLPARLNEFAIFIRVDTQYEWFAHELLALKAGLKPEIAADLEEGRRSAA